MFATRLLRAGGRVFVPAAALLFALHAPLSETAKAQDVPQDIPGYSVQFIGSGTPKAVNSDGLAVGWKNVNGNILAWVGDGGGQMDLPLLDDMPNARANDINDFGEIVGSAWTSILDEPGVAVIWEPDGPGRYTVRALETDPTDRNSEARAINNNGDIAGVRTLSNNVTKPAFLIRDGAFIDFSEFGATPEDINNNGFVVGGSKLFDPDLGTVTDFGQPPRADGLRYSFAFFYALNDGPIAMGPQSAGFAKTTSGDSRRAVLHNNGVKVPLWEYISQTGVFDAAYGINEGGDVVFEAAFLCGGNASPMVYLDDGEGGGTRHCLQDLIVTPGWFPLNANFDADINDSGQIVTVARNSDTGQSGAVLLSPGETLSVPLMPTGLEAAPHVAGTAPDNWNGIQVTWQDNADETSYRLERSPGGAGSWAAIANPPMNSTAFNDNVGPTGKTYDYRLYAVNAAGSSPASEVASATAPDAGVDNDPPWITITEPEAGAIVSGSVKVTMNATDKVGVARVDLRTDTGLLICDVPSPTGEDVTCSWNTRKVATGPHTLTARAWDAAGNMDSDTITLTVEKKKGGGPKGPKNN